MLQTWKLICLNAVMAALIPAAGLSDDGSCALEDRWVSQDGKKTIEIYLSDAKYFAEVVASEDEKAQPGEVIFRDIAYDADKEGYVGKISPPGKDREFKMVLRCESEDTIRMTAKILFAKKSQTWTRLED